MYDILKENPAVYTGKLGTRALRRVGHSTAQEHGTFTVRSYSKPALKKAEINDKDLLILVSLYIALKSLFQMLLPTNEPTRHNHIEMKARNDCRKSQHTVHFIDTIHMIQF